MSVIIFFQILVDLFMISASWIITYTVRFHTGFDAPLGIPDPWLYYKLIPFICVIWSGAFMITGVYRRGLSRRSAIIEGADLIQSCVTATVIFIAFTYFYEEYRYSRLNTAIFALLHPPMLILGRSLLRKTVRFYVRNNPAKKVLIIFSPDKIHECLQLYSQSSLEKREISGVVPITQPSQKVRDFLLEAGLPILDPPKNWATFLFNRDISSAFLGINNEDHDFLTENLELIASQIPDVKLLPDFGKFSKLSMGLESIKGVPVITFHNSPLDGTGTVFKRLVDFIGALSILLLISPIFLVSAIAVWLSSPGPILYRQERMGLDGRKFFCLKFRSMPLDAEKKSGAVFATSHDQRATLVGKFLRRSSLDELPQLINVIKGEMSLVGPRPERPVFVREFREKVPGYMLRHKVKAGITGWAQVNGWRGNTSIEKRIECDLFYIQNWSLWLDFKILFLTIEEVLTGKNAY